MTITYAGIGSTVTGNNASLNPSMVAGVVEGDLLLITASIRNSGAGAVDVATLQASGWQPVLTFGNLAVVGKFYTAGVTAPTVAYTGGVANADTQAAMTAWRGVSPDALTATVSATQLNGSVQDIAYPALNVPGANHAVLLAAWKQDDATSIAMPGGFTGVINSFATAGDDASLRMGYSIQTTEVDITSGSLVVTGGLAAISRATVLALKPAAAITVTTQTSWPPRNLISVTGLTLGDDVAVYRQVAGERTLLRAGAAADVLDPSFLVIDAELPFGVSVSYVAVVNSLAEYPTSPAVYTLPGGKVAVSDAVGGAAAETVILAWPEKDRDTNSAVYRAGGRNIVVSGPLGQFTSTIEFYTETTSAVDNLTDALASATSNTVQIRQAGGYDGVDCYVAVLKTGERRWSQDGSDQRRVIAVDVVEVDGWAPTLEARGFTYQDVADYYGTANYTTAEADHATYLTAAQGDYSP